MMDFDLIFVYGTPIIIVLFIVYLVLKIVRVIKDLRG